MNTTWIFQPASVSPVKESYQLITEININRCIFYQIQISCSLKLIFDVHQIMENLVLWQGLLCYYCSFQMLLPMTEYCVHCTQDNCVQCLISFAYNWLRKNFEILSLLLNRIVAASESEAFTVSLTQLLALAGKLPQAILQEGIYHST